MEAPERRGVTDLSCLDCRAPLADATRELGGERLLCACGLRYSTGALASFDVDWWRRAQEGRLFRREGGTLWMTTPLEAILEWPP